MTDLTKIKALVELKDELTENIERCRDASKEYRSALEAKDYKAAHKAGQDCIDARADFGATLDGKMGSILLSAIAELAPLVAEKPTHVVVPVEPTQEMLEAAKTIKGGWANYFTKVFKAMLAARPK